MDRQKIGLIGLGAMGRGVAENLIAKRYEVVGFDIRPDARDWMTARGGNFADSLQDLGRQCSIVVSFVVNDAQTEEILFGSNGLVGSLKAGAIFVACSTMPPDYVGSLAKRLSACSISLIDAPVSGGTVGAMKGTLTIMAAGEKEAFSCVKPVLDAFGGHIHHISEKPGAGSQLKVINQLLCGVHLAAAGEALALAKRQGLPLDIAMEVLRSGAGFSWMLGDRGPRMTREAFDEVTSAIDIFVKDLGLVLDAARSAKFPAPLASAAHGVFMAASGSGKGRWDDSAVMTSYIGIPYEGEIPPPQKRND